MSETDGERFLDKAEECLREAEKAISPHDKERWLRFAEEWMKLAQAAKDNSMTGA